MGCDDVHAGPDFTDDDARRWIAENEEGLASYWEIGLRMAIAYPHSRDEYTCPQCYAKVERPFLSYHDGWHKRLKVSTIMGFGI